MIFEAAMFGVITLCIGVGLTTDIPDVALLAVPLAIVAAALLLQVARLDREVRQVRNWLGKDQPR